MFQCNIAAAAAAAANDKKEGFAANDPIIITDNLLNIKEADKEISTKYIIVNSKFLGRIIDNVKKTNLLNKNTIGIDEIPSNANIQLLVDPYINYYVLKSISFIRFKCFCKGLFRIIIKFIFIINLFQILYES
jgi:hypothetical protein